jgi:hypothetical protein
MGKFKKLNGYELVEREAVKTSKVQTDEDVHSEVEAAC